MTKKIISGLIAFFLMCTGFFSASTAFAASGDSVTINYYIVDGELNKVTANDENNYKLSEKVVYKPEQFTEQLGKHNALAHTNEGLIKMRPFMGWSTLKRADFDKTAEGQLYSETQTVGEVVKANPELKEITLYSLYDGRIGKSISLLGKDIPFANSNYNRHVDIRMNHGMTKDTVSTMFSRDLTLKDYAEEPYEIKYSGNGFADTDRGKHNINTTISAYIDQEIPQYNLGATALFNYNKGIAFVVKTNAGHWGTPLRDSEVEMTMLLDENYVSIPNRIEGLTFSSYTFQLKRAFGYTADGKKKDVDLEITKYSPESPLTSFNLANLSGLKNITLVAKPKNQTDDNKNIDAVSKFTAKEYTQDMLLHMPQGVAFIPQEKAVKAANEQQIIATSGSVSGTIAHTSIGPFSPSDTISLRESNAINIKFVPAMVNFIDNGAKLGGTDASLGYAKFALNGKLADDVFNTGTAPAPLTDANGTKTTAGDSMHAWVVGENYSVNGTSRTFAGWNTKADGTGTMVYANTKLTKDLFNAAEADVEDLKLYAMWQGNVKYKFAADPKLTDAPALPQSVMQKLPAQGTAIIGAEVTPAVVNSDPIVDNVNRGKWIFKGWTPATATLPFSGELTFTGYWTFTKNPVAPVNYKFAVNPKTTNSPTLPDFLKKYLPPSTSTEIGTQVTPTPINPGTQEDSANGGKWTFDGWNPATATEVTKTGITFTGYWTFTKNPVAPQPKPSDPIIEPKKPEITPQPKPSDPIIEPKKPEITPQPKPSDPIVEPKKQDQQDLAKTGSTLGLPGALAALFVIVGVIIALRTRKHS